MTSASRAEVLVTVVPNSWEQNLSSVTQIRPGESRLSHRRLHRHRRLMAVAVPGPRILLPAFAALPAKERVDFGLDGRLHHEPD